MRGYWADLVLVESDGGEPRRADSRQVRVDPVQRVPFSARVRATWVNGELRYRDGRFLPGTGGRALEFDR